MANSVDPDQTAPSRAVWSGSVLFAYAILSETLVYEILGYLLPIDKSKKKSGWVANSVNQEQMPHRLWCLIGATLFAHSCMSQYL